MQSNKVILSRSEMKTILGGMAQTAYSCTFQLTTGDRLIQYTTVKTVYSSSDGGAGAQCLADSACWDNDNCTGVDCTGTSAC